MVEWLVRRDGGRGAVRSQTRGRGGVGGAKNPKPSCLGSISGLPCQTAMVGGGQRWWCGAYKAMSAVE